MSLGKRLFTGGGAAAAACSTDTVDIFGDSNGVALYSLDHDASDASGNHNGTVSGGVTFGVDGQINWGASFDGGSSTHIEIPDSDVFSPVTNDFSASMWVKPTSGHVMSKQGEWHIRTYGGGADGFVEFWLFRSGGGSTHTRPIAAYNTGITDGDWHHLVVTADYLSSYKIYLDGVKIAETTSGFSGTSVNTSNPVRIGSNGTATTERYVGDLDQVRFFKKALSQDEVDTLYAETACVYTSTTDTIDYQGTNLAYYKLDNNALDETSNNYDGTESNISYEFGRFGTAAVFNGSSSEIQFTTDSNFVNDFTISAWINMNQLPVSGYLYQVVAWGDEAAGERRSLGIWNGGSGDPKVYFSGYGGAANFGGSTSVSANQWHHVCLTRSGSNVKVYLNGSLDGTGTVTLNAYTGTTGRIGASGSANENFNGSIDQVRIYNSALDSTAVANLYNEKPEASTSNFETVTYSGTGNSQYISNVGIDLKTYGGLIWFKERNGTNQHQLYDNVRGYDNAIYSNANTAEYNYSTHPNGDLAPASVEANGFFTPTVVNNGINRNGGTYVAWVWKGGGDPVSNTSGDVACQVSANQDAGFSIVGGTGSTYFGGSLGHGLSQAPELILYKDYSVANSWYVYHKDLTIPNNYFLHLDQTAAQTNYGQNVWNVTSTTFSSDLGVTRPGIAYCFHSVAGYSKIGSFTYSAGVSVNVGFAPQFVMFKKVSAAGSWTIVDNKRFSGTTDYGLFANLDAAEVTNTDYLNLTSTGFTTTYSDTGTFIYLAIA